MESLAGLRERRAFECRLTQDRALGSLDEAEGFLRERGMLTGTANSALPSLYEACHEEAHQPGEVGGHTHSTELARWDQAYPAMPAAAPASPYDPSSPSGALGDLLVTAVRATVIAPESEVRR